MSEVRPTLAVIPARAGSKAVAHKNVRDVGGRPLIAWTIDAARRARGLDRIVVSTDDPAIATIAVNCGAEAPFLRPAELARDDTPGPDAILHAVDWFELNEDFRPQSVVVLQPTSPLRTAGDIDAALTLMQRLACTSVVSVTPTPHHPFWTKRVDEAYRVSDFIPADPAMTTRQDLPPAFILNGAIYIVRRDVLVHERSLYGADVRAYVMPPERSLDIDTEWDLRVADLILSERR